MQPIDVPLDKILLDPNNYRLQELAEYVSYPEERFHQEQVQKTTLQRLQRESIKELKNSILSNGFLPIERIVVTKYKFAKDFYLVIEGNRRIAALKAINEQFNAGIDVPDRVVKTINAVPCILIEENDEYPYFKETLMGVRHVGGIRQWGGFQRAKLIADLRDLHKVDSSDVSDRLGLSTIEVNRRYRAFKALQQMQEDEDFGEFATPSLYPLFHEAVALPAVRNWLGWDQTNSAFTNLEELSNFYALITPSKNSEENEEEELAKLQTYSDVRSLKDILPIKEAKDILLDPTKKLANALAVVTKDNIVKRWRNEVTEARSALEKVGAIEVKNFTAADISAINELVNTANAVIEIFHSLQAK